MRFQINKEVIDSIKLARDFQLVKEPESGDKAALAHLAFNNGHRVEMILNLKKLTAWTRTFKQGQFDGSFKADLIDASQVGERDYAGWLQLRAALTENRSSELKMCPGGLTYAEPIEVQIADGVAQIVPSPGGATELKAIRAANRIESRRLKLQAAVTSLESKLFHVRTYRDKEAQKHDEAAVWLEGHDLLNAVRNAWMRRDQARIARRIEAKLKAGESVKDDLLALGLLARPELPREDLSPPTSLCFNCNEETGKTPAAGYWPVCADCQSSGAAEFRNSVLTVSSAVQEYDSCWMAFLAAKKRHDTYKPKKTWGRHVQHEQAKRMDNMLHARRAVEHVVRMELINWMKDLSGVEISDYAEHRQVVRRWRGIERATAVEIEQFEQDLRVARSALEEFEAANPPKTEPERSEQIESHPDLTIQLLDAEGIDQFKPLAEIAREAQESWQQAQSELLDRSEAERLRRMPDATFVEEWTKPAANQSFGFNELLAEAERRGYDRAGNQVLPKQFREPGSDAPTPISQSSSAAAAAKENIMSATSPATDAITLSFVKEKETKNTIKFEEVERDGQPKIVGSLYVQRFIAKGREKLTVTITF